MFDNSFLSRLRTGLALPGITVAFTPARAATSHLRRRYHERYKGRYRFPALLFAIDLSIIVLVLGIVATSIWFSLWKPLPESGLRLVFSAPPITTATTIAFEADVSVQDQKSHPDVRLRWILPPGTEIITASPPVDTRREALLGDVHPGEKRVARLAVRMMAPRGSVRIGFQLRSGNELLSGEEVRPIIGSALHLEPVLKSTAAAPDFDVYVLKNLGNSSIDCAQVQTDASFPTRADAQAVYNNVSGGRAVFDTIGPHESRFLSIQRSPGAIRVLCGAVELEQAEITNLPKPTNIDAITLDVGPSTPGQETVIPITSAEPLRVLVHHPLLQNATDGFRWFDVGVGDTRLTLPLDKGKHVTLLPDRIPTWRAWLVRSTPAGQELVAFDEAPITTTFVLSSEARYYAASGGQIGAGPLPPEVGKTTRYWVQWKLEPTQSDLSNVEVKTTLPKGVTWTGQTALPNGGTLDEQDGVLTWRLPFLPATLESTTVAFEVALTPTTEMRNAIPTLLSETRVQAGENRSGAVLGASTKALDTSLPIDERARGKGSVR